MKAGMGGESWEVYFLTYKQQWWRAELVFKPLEAEFLPVGNKNTPDDHSPKEAGRYQLFVGTRHSTVLPLLGEGRQPQPLGHLWCESWFGWMSGPFLYPKLTPGAPAIAKTAISITLPMQVGAPRLQHATVALTPVTQRKRACFHWPDVALDSEAEEALVPPLPEAFRLPAEEMSAKAILVMRKIFVAFF